MSSVRRLLYGASPMPPERLRAAIDLFGHALQQCYGRTESAPFLTTISLRGGWLHTGDIAMVDEDGYLYIVDRAKDMIISGGENVYSTEVEAVLYEHAAVLEAAVIGVPDERGGGAGKILKSELRKPYWEGQARRVH